MVTGSLIGRAIKKIRQERGLSQGDVIRQIRKNSRFVERNFLTKLENEKVMHPRLETIQQILSGLGVSLSAFIIYCELDMNLSIEVIVKKLVECIREMMGPGWPKDKATLYDFITSNKIG